MASPSGRDDDSKKNAPKEENPFIRFRQFADSQISSLLQGVIGLPSAFSRRPVGTQWDSIDEDLKRRDELQARQKALKEAVSMDEHRNKEAVALPLETSPSWNTWGKYITTAEQYAGAEGMKDLPLYSPVTKALFAHLQQAESLDDWQRRDVSEARSSPNVSPYGFFRGQMSMDVLKMTQTAIFHDLNRSPTLRSEYSALPYILFSPYSPIHLTAEAQKRNSDIQFNNEYLRGMDTFDYLGAFEDLLQVQSGLPRQIWSVFSSRPSQFLPVTPHQAFAGLNTNMSWIAKMHFGNVLQEQESRTIPQALIPRVRAEMREETELDLYEQLSRTFEDLKKSFPPLKELSAEIEGMMKSGENAITTIIQQFMDDKGHDEDNDKAEDVWSKLCEHVKEIEDELTRRGYDCVNPSNPAEVEQNEQSLPSATTSTTSDPGRVTSSSTTTTRRIRSDGTVESKVTVHKTFADGSSTTTTTERFDDSADEKEQQNEAFEEPTTQDDGRVVVQGKKHEKGKGWFWN